MTQPALPGLFNRKSPFPFVSTAGLWQIRIFYQFKNGAFTAEDMKVLQPIVDQIGAIIQRVRLFEQVSDDSKYIHNLLNSIDSAVFTVNANYEITEVNQAWRGFITQGMQEWADEEAIIGQSLRVILPGDELWEKYRKVMDDLFTRRVESYSREFIVYNGRGIAYHLVINPMVIKDRVTALVFTQTDITEINRTEAEIKRRNKELVALNTIATSISGSLELNEVLRVASGQLRETFEAGVVAFI